MHPDAEAQILSLAQPLEEPDRTAFMKAAAEAVETLGPQTCGPGDADVVPIRRAR